MLQPYWKAAAGKKRKGEKKTFAFSRDRHLVAQFWADALLLLEVFDNTKGGVSMTM